MKPSTNGMAPNKSANPSSSSSSSNNNSKGHSKKPPSKSSSASVSKSKKTSNPAVVGAASTSGHGTAQAAGVKVPNGSSGAHHQSAENNTAAPVIGSANGRDKSQFKGYAGFQAKSMKVMWEQYNQHETDVLPDVLTRLAEDATYKVWELCNNLKTYSRHSGGMVTMDSVNEVLKDSDVPPVIGAGTSQWDHDSDHAGTYYFPSDETLELRDEYLKEVSITQCGTLRLLGGWIFDTKAATDLTVFRKALAISVIAGDEETFDYAMNIAKSSPFVACVIRSLLRFCIKTLMFEHSDETLDRIVSFLSAILHNPSTQDCTIQDDQMFHLSQLMVCLVLGPLDLNEDVIAVRDNAMYVSKRKWKINPKQVIHVKEEPVDEKQPELQPLTAADLHPGQFVHIEPCPIEDVLKHTKFVIHNDTGAEQFSTLFSSAVSFEKLDDTLTTIGNIASKWGSFENELLYLVVQRMDLFFSVITETTIIEYEWIARVVRLLWTLGDFAFREMTVHFDKMDPLQMPEWIQSFFNVTAIFLRGRDDIFLYEYLYDLCGDGLAPFMVYYTKYTERHALRLKRRRDKANAAALCIPPRRLLRRIQLPENPSQSRAEMHEIFTDYKVAKYAPHMEFDCPGFRPKFKLKLKSMLRDKSTAKHLTVDTKIFSSSIVVARRRLMPKLVNGKANLDASYELRRLVI